MNTKLRQYTLSALGFVSAFCVQASASFAAGIADLNVKSLAYMITDFFAKLIIPLGVTALFGVFVWNVITYLKQTALEASGFSEQTTLFSFWYFCHIRICGICGVF